MAERASGCRCVRVQCGVGHARQTELPEGARRPAVGVFHKTE